MSVIYLQALVHSIGFEISKIDGFVAPEYNGNVPPSFANFLAFCSKSSKDWRELFNTKKAVVAHSGGGGAHVLMHMRMQLSFIGMMLSGAKL